MNHAQILSISITVLAILAGSFYNNSRISDTNTRIGDLGTRFDRRIDDTRDVLRAEMNVHFTHLEAIIERNQETVMRMLADHDQRLAKLEGGRS